MTKQRKSKKWEALLGCTAVFEKSKKGIYLNIFTKARAYRMPGGCGNVSWMVMGYSNDLVQISPDGISVSLVKKKFCKII